MGTSVQDMTMLMNDHGGEAPRDVTKTRDAGERYVDR